MQDDACAADQVITDSRYPGLALTLPAGVTIVGWDGVPKQRVALDRLSPDRLPVPPPSGFTPRSLYRVHFGTPMGGVPSAPLPITLPNDGGLEPGEQTELWYYDAAPFPGVPATWRLAGTATVSADGTTVVSDPGVGLERFCGVCGISCFPPRQPRRNPDGPQAGEPVDLSLGQQIVEETDLVLPGRIPAVVHRTYNPIEAFGRIAGFELGLGPGWALSVDAVLLELSATLRRLILPGNAVFDFVPQPDATWRPPAHPRFAGAVLTADGAGGHALRYKTGTVWRFATGWVTRGQPLVGLGLLVEERDRNGNRLTIERQANGIPTRLLEPGGRELRFTIGNVGGPPTAPILRILSIQDPQLGRTVRYEYAGADRRLRTVTDPQGATTLYTYNGVGGIVATVDRRGAVVVTNAYDVQNRVVRQVQADGGEWTFSYAGPVGGHTRAGVTDPRGQTTTYAIGNAGFAQEIVDALGQATRIDRDAQGQVTAVTDPLGRVTRYTYDAQSNVTSRTDPASGVRTFTYEPVFNRVATITDELGQVTRFEYDAQGNLTAVELPTGARATAAYDAAGDLLTVTDPLGNTTRFEYDGLGSLTAAIDPLGNRTTLEYDAVSRLIGQTDPLGVATRYRYDAVNRLADVTDPLNGMTRLSYDFNGNLLTVTDARGQTTRYTYDALNRVVTRADPLGASEQFAYDGRGNLLRRTNRKGQATTFGYDGASRRTDVAYADGSTRRIVYDAVGRVVEVADSAGGPVLHDYDLLDRLVAQTTRLGTVRYGYDPLRRRVQMEVPDQPPVTYAYDAASRLTEVAQAGRAVTLTYDPLGRRTRLTLPNGVSTEYGYDAASRLVRLAYGTAAGALGDLTYAYDAVGRRVGVGGAFARLPDAVSVASYDAANRQLAFGDKTLAYACSCLWLGLPAGAGPSFGGAPPPRSGAVTEGMVGGVAVPGIPVGVGYSEPTPGLVNFSVGPPGAFFGRCTCALRRAS